MHRDNPYLRQRPNFASLAERYPPLAPYVTITSTDAHIDFNNAAALRALTTALLHADFGLSVNLRDDRLCPTLANRLDYVLLCLDLAKHTPNREQPPRALDIGTGHVAIYALLLSHYGVDVTASELDPTSLAHAESTVATNNIANIQIRPPPPDASLLGYLKESDFTFTLCNPPFFASEEELASSRESKALPAPAAPTASANEEITPGGEEAFVGRMVEESVDIGQGCAWYTSLVGRYASLPGILGRIKAVTANWYVVQLRQARTTRWIVVWGYTGCRLPDSLTRPEHLDERTSYARLLPLPNSFIYKGKSVHDLQAAVLPVLREVGLYDGTEDDEEAAANGIDLAPCKNTWSRAARRAAQREAEAAGEAQEDKKGTTEDGESTDPLFRATLSFHDDVEGAAVRLDWTFGMDREIVDGFWKFLVSKAGLGKRGRADDGGAPKDRAKAWRTRGRGRGRGFVERTRDNGWNNVSS